MRIDGRTALVTGGSDGIGLELARQLKAKGAAVIVCGRDAGRLESARGEGFEAIAADLSSAAGCDALVAALGGREVDILVNNAGMSERSSLLTGLDLASVDRAIFTNLNAPIHLIDALLPMLCARPEAAIVNVTSGLAIAPRGDGPIYCATKAGLRSFTQALRHQLRDSRVTVIEALPPVVETKMTAGNTHKKMPAADCAAAIVRAIERGEEEVAIGAVKWLRRVYGVSPAFARRVMLRY